MIPNRPSPQSPPDESQPSYQERARAAEKAVDLVAATLGTSDGSNNRFSK
jgi:hypothetical protein